MDATVLTFNSLRGDTRPRPKHTQLKDEVIVLEEMEDPEPPIGERKRAETRALLAQLLPCFSPLCCVAFVVLLAIPIGVAVWDVSNARSASTGRRPRRRRRRPCRRTCPRSSRRRRRRRRHRRRRPRPPDPPPARRDRRRRRRSRR